jgi:uncharacterized membrane protein YkoI
MKTTCLLLAAVVTFCAAPVAAQAESGKIMNEERLRGLIKDKLTLGKLEFVERRDDDSLTVYEYFLMQGDTLHKVVVNARRGEIDTVLVEVQQGRAILQARQIAQTRAEAAALAKIPGEIIRWKLKKSEGVWFYKFRVATPKGKLKDVFVEKESFEVKHVRKHEEVILEQ